MHPGGPEGQAQLSATELGLPDSLRTPVGWAADETGLRVVQGIALHACLSGLKPELGLRGSPWAG